MEAQGHILVRRKAKDGIDGANGEPGKDGLQGCILRQSEWAEGIEYRNDEALTSGTRYLDIAIVTTGANTFNAYKCMKTHTSGDSIPVTNTTYWQKFNSLVPVYTPLIMAQNAILRFMQGNQLLIMKSNNATVAAGFAGGNCPLWVGATTPDGAPFKVSIDGKLTAVNAEITGKITATEGEIAGLKLSNNGLRSSNFNASLKVGSCYAKNGFSVYVSESGILAPSTGGLQAGIITATGDNAEITGLEIIAKNTSSYATLSKITALKLKTIEYVSGEMAYPPVALETENGRAIFGGAVEANGTSKFNGAVYFKNVQNVNGKSNYYLCIDKSTGQLYYR